MRNNYQLAMRYLTRIICDMMWHPHTRRWSDKVHGKQETYYIWVEDPDNNHMYHHEHFTITKKQVCVVFATGVVDFIFIHLFVYLLE